MGARLRDSPRFRTTEVRPRCDQVSAQGHTSLTQSATAASSRSIARRADT